jgi:hypothetical protein
MLEVLLLVHWAQADRQVYSLPLNLEVGLPGHQRGQDLILEVKHLAREDQVEPPVWKAAELQTCSWSF